MYRVSFKLDIYDYLLNYFDKYSEYFEKLYKDSGVWSENQIINSYIEESKVRKIEVLDIIEETLQEENILGRKGNNTIVVKWRTKYLIVEWSEDNISKKRTVNNVEIR